MSGGSYNYFCYKDRTDIAPYRETLQEMEQDMERHSSFDVSDVRAEMKDIALVMDQAAKRVEGLHHVLHAFEWWMSGDYEEDDFQKHVEEWRKQPKGEQS